MALRTSTGNSRQKRRDTAWLGQVQVYTGNGKGKTTAAMGLALRAAGAGLGVWIGQFLKSRPCGEHQTLARLGRRIVIERFGSGRWIRRGRPDAAEALRARRGLAAARRALHSGRYRVVILDEVNCALAARLLGVREVLRLLRERPADTEVILTGRQAPPSILAAADLVTEMREIRHYYQKGVEARAGIER